MTDAQASEAARALANTRWRGQVVERAARTVVERVDELPLTLRAEVHSATADREDVTDE
jgi:hypothetical protein